MMRKNQKEASKEDSDEESQQDVAANEKGIHNLRFDLWGWGFTGPGEKQQNGCDDQSTEEGKNDREPSNTGGPGEQHAQEQNQRPEQG